MLTREHESAMRLKVVQPSQGSSYVPVPVRGVEREHYNEESRKVNEECQCGMVGVSIAEIGSRRYGALLKDEGKAPPSS